MPLILHETIASSASYGELGVWRISETEAELHHQLELHATEYAQLSKIKGEGRRREFLAARKLLHEMSGREERGVLYKDEYGKPFLADTSWQVSISHTTGLSAAVAHPRKCGVDIQIFVPKIARLAKRFMGAAEIAQLTAANQLIFQHLVWSAKEAMYKAYGRKEVDFRQHLFVDLANIPLESGHTMGWLKKQGVDHTYRLDYRILDNNYMLVTGIEV